MIMNIQEIGERIRLSRKENGKTLQDIADEIGVSKSTIQRYEKGTFDNVKIPVIEAIANSINVNPLWLLGKSSEKGVPVSKEDVFFQLSEHEKNVIFAYREKRDMQNAVDTLLGIDSQKADGKNVKPIQSDVEIHKELTDSQEVFAEQIVKSKRQV